MPTTLTNGIQLPDKGSVDWYNSMQSNYNLIDTHLGNTDTHVTAEDKANWNSKQGSLSQTQLDAIAQVATNTSDIASLQSGKANASHTHSSSDITDIGDYATKQYVDTSISGLVDSAPNALDTLNELAAALNDDANFATTVTNALSAKANSADLATIATSGDYDDLSNKPSIPTNTSDLNNDSGFVTLNDFDIPSKTSDLTNDSGFITSSDVPISTSDLINDSNFVDTSNSAVASGITSAKVTDYDTHIADTDIHVTTADKNKWNNNTYVFRYSSTALTASSTNSNTLLDNTDNLKVGDKVIDSDGVLFSITAIDTANSTFSIGTALIDLAQDSDVVHKSGAETISGVKSFINYFLGKDLSGQTVDLNDCVDAYGGAIHYYYAVSNYTNISNKPENKPFILESKTVRYVSSIDYICYQKIYTADYNAPPSIYTRYYRSGSASWSNWVKDTDKFVTTDTNQTISGNKTFLDVPITLKSSTAELGVTGGNAKVIFTDKNLLNLAGITFGNYGSSKLSYCRFHIYDKDSNNQEVENFIEFSYVNNNQVAYFRPNKSNFVTLGTVNNRWSKVYADEFYYGSNNVEFSTKFVTTDTAQDISANKNFRGLITTTPNSPLWTVNTNTTADITSLAPTCIHVESKPAGSLIDLSGGAWYVAQIGTGCFFFRQNTGTDIRYKHFPTNTVSKICVMSNDNKFISDLCPDTTNSYNLGDSTNKWATINGLTPSALGMPDLNNGIDISSYIDVSGVSTNHYTPPANGWISISVISSSRDSIQIESSSGFSSGAYACTNPNNTSEYIASIIVPCVKNDTVTIYFRSSANTSTIKYAKFFPCQGNV